MSVTNERVFFAFKVKTAHGEHNGAYTDQMAMTRGLVAAIGTAVGGRDPVTDLRCGTVVAPNRDIALSEVTAGHFLPQRVTAGIRIRDGI